MKNLFKNLMLVAVAAMAFTACQKDNNEVNTVAKESTIEFTAGFDASRSQFGEKDGDAYPSFWNGGEQVLAAVADENNNTSVSAYMEKVDEAGASANFSATFYGDYTDGTITVYSPYHNSSANSGWWSEWIDGGYQMVPQIPSTQTPDANSVEARAHILKAEHSFAGALTSGYVNLTFEHAVAYAKMTLNLGDVVALEDIASVRVVFGEQAYTLLPDNLTEPTFWFACKEAEVETMTITITDTDGATYVREITTTEEKPLAFVTGQVSKFTVGGFEEIVLDYVTGISAMFSSYSGRYEFTIDTVDGARIWLYIYTWPEGGLLAETEDEDGYADNNSGHNIGYLYADYANWDGYANITETSILVEHLEEGYCLDVYFVDSKGKEWTFVYEGVVSGICNPPAPEAEAVEAVAEAVSGNGEQYFTLNFTADNYKFSEMWFDTEVAGKIIAEGTHDIEGAVAYLNAEGEETGWEFVAEGTVTVAHDAENKQYNLAFDLEDGNGSTFTVTYVGQIEGVYSPGDATPLPNPSNVNVEVVNYTDAKVTWDAVEGAASYELYYSYYADGDQESEPVTATDTTYTFEGLTAGVYYTIYVKALPATAANTESEYASVYNVQVYNNPASMETKYTFTQAANIGENKIKFSNEAGDYCVIKFASSLTSIAPGMYTSSASGDFYVDNWNSGFNGSTQMYPFGFVNVEGEAGAEQTVTIVGAEAYYGEQVKAVFTGVIDMEVAPIEFTICKVTPSGNDLSFRFESATGEYLLLHYYANGAMGFAEGEYTLVKTTDFDGYKTYNNKYQYPETISLKVTGNIGEVQTYEFVITIEGGATYKANYTGVAEGKILYGMTEPVSLAITGSGNDLFYKFTDAEGNTLCINVYNGAPYRDSGTNYTYYELAGGSRRSIQSISAFSYEVNEDGSYLFTEVCATDSESYIHMFSNVTLSAM